MTGINKVLTKERGSSSTEKSKLNFDQIQIQKGFKK